jgi:hypothetical protein
VVLAMSIFVCTLHRYIDIMGNNSGINAVYLQYLVFTIVNTVNGAIFINSRYLCWQMIIYPDFRDIKQSWIQ